eukprot:6171331-Amphidinium_carterae.1
MARQPPGLSTSGPSDAKLFRSVKASAGLPNFLQHSVTVHPMEGLRDSHKVEALSTKTATSCLREVFTLSWQPAFHQKLQKSMMGSCLFALLLCSHAKLRATRLLLKQLYASNLDCNAFLEVTWYADPFLEAYHW